MSLGKKIDSGVTTSTTEFGGKSNPNTEQSEPSETAKILAKIEMTNPNPVISERIRIEMGMR